MPTPCQKFAQLSSRVALLTAKFVADQIAAEARDPIVFSPDPERLAAFRLLAHAEFEDFIEVKALEGLAELESRAKASVYSMKAIRDVFHLSCLVAKPLAIDPLSSTRFEDQVKLVITEARTAVSKNNGIKISSFFLLSAFFGKLADEIDTSLAAGLDSYGKSRGDVAHRSVSRVTTIRAPSDEAKTASELVAALGKHYDVTVP